jgi:hypothetical protein
MGEVWHLVARIAIGWFGVSFVACAVWIMTAAGMHRLDKNWRGYRRSAAPEWRRVALVRSQRVVMRAPR